VDGVYDRDPATDPAAVRLPELTHLDIIQRQLRVMDLTAISLCMDNRMPIVVCDIFHEQSLAKIIHGERIGTLVS
ncbi:MAG TPA: UMP kinase, partial [Spirochaetota bacterium]|nr:UMP kinase [Spirochaetota bacterium]